MKLTSDFPREYKFTMGQKIQEELVNLIVIIYRANSAENKEAHINLFLERLQVVELLIRLSHDLRLFSVKGYAGLVEMTESLAKQAQGWKKNCSKK
jgi:hypothetical protein